MKNPHDAKFISFASPKGGVGKSTACLSIAGALLHAGQRVRIIDFDQTQTVRRWYDDSAYAHTWSNLTVEKGPDTNLDAYVEQLWATATDYVLIDLAGSLSDVTIAIAAFATLTITPAKVSEPDIMEANRMAEKIHGLAARMGKPINHRVLFNEVPSSISNDELALIAQFDESGLDRFQTLIHRRSAFSKTFSRGTVPHLAATPDPKALAEIDSLMLEVNAIFNHDKLKAAA